MLIIKGMPEKDVMKEFIKYAKDKVYFYIESKFWSKLDIDTFHAWLSNFESTEEKYCALKLLDRFVYYSEEDMIRMIDFGFYESILKRKILGYEISNDFQVKNETLLNFKKDFTSNTYVMPLLTDNLSESSLVMARYLTNDIGFPEKNMLYLNNLKSIDLQKAKNLIILDDFVGSSTQLHTFWNSTSIKIDGEVIFPKKLKAMFPHLDIEYFCLICTEEGFTNFHSQDNDVGLRITYCELLTNKYKVFGKDSVYFNNEEVEVCKNVLDLLCKKKGISLLGYKSLDYAIAFHHSIPDSSLPLFYSQFNNWNPLFKNKKTFANVTI